MASPTREYHQPHAAQTQSNTVKEIAPVSGLPSASEPFHDQLTPQMIKDPSTLPVTRHELNSTTYPIIHNLEVLRHTLLNVKLRTEKQHKHLNHDFVKFGNEISEAVEHLSARSYTHSDWLVQIEKENRETDIDDRRLRDLLEGRFKEIDAKIEALTIKLKETDQREQDYRKMADAKIEALTMKLKESEERNKRMDELEARLNHLTTRIHVDPDTQAPVWVEMEEMTLEEQD